MCRGRGLAERVGVRQPLVLGGERSVLAGLGRRLLDLHEAETQQVGLLRPLS